MSSPDVSHGDFTLPGEAGHEALTLRLAKKWGADTIRDSDGTQLSPEILASGRAIYSTLCLVRSVQAWARDRPETWQQNYLLSRPVVATGRGATAPLLDGYFPEQFVVNADDAPARWWQVHDRTTGSVVSARRWRFSARRGVVVIADAVPGHTYTVSFLARRRWEEISMYNHLTNDWGEREHLVAVDPMHPEVRRRLARFLEDWLRAHPDTGVVRFTSLFYNFSWFWGADHARQRDVYADWGDYAMSVSPRALTAFARSRGWRLEAEDFVRGGLYNSTHNVPSARYRAYMDFLHDFVIGFGRRCVARVHRHGKKAFVFYDDHWIGVEPNSPRFPEFGFDGLIKCVFNAFEVRLCAHAPGPAVRELRLHPYLFPTGLQGEPTFQPGGDPTRDAKRFWIDARRGLLRARIDRIGLGGYLSLVEPFPEFQDYVAELAREFRLLKHLHAAGRPWTAPGQVAVLTAWGDLRAWVCSGHFVRGQVLNEVLEALAGLPLDVVFLSFDDLRRGGVPREVKVILNAGHAGSAWSGGEHWADPTVEARLTEWVRRGGGLVGLGEPSACAQPGRFFRLAAVFGVDRDRGERLANGRFEYDVPGGADGAGVARHFVTAELAARPQPDNEVPGIFVLGAATEVLAAGPGGPSLTVHRWGRGRAVYASGFKCAPEQTRWLHRALVWAAGREAEWARWNTTNPRTECAWFPGARRLVVVNNADQAQTTVVTLGDGRTKRRVRLAAHGIRVLAVPGRRDPARPEAP